MAFDLERYLGVLEDHNLMTACPSCGVLDWGAASTEIIVSAHDPGGDQQGVGFTAVTLICENCGLMQMHHTPVLDRWLSDPGQAPGEQADSG